MAPSVSPARSNPHALPSDSAGTELARMAFRAGARMPRPNHPTARPTSTSGQPEAIAKIDPVLPVRKYPATAIGLRRPARSETHPDTSLASVAMPSARPSTRPSAAAETPRAVRKPGRTVVTISCPTSERRLVSPMPKTFRLSHAEGCLAAMPSHVVVDTGLAFALLMRKALD